MNYAKTTWVDGDVITAAKLNKNENQTALNETLHVPFAVTADAGGMTGTTSATFESVIAAITAGRDVVADVTVNNAYVMYAPLTVKLPVSNPTYVAFGVVAKIDVQAPSSFYQITLDNNGLVGVIAEANS